MRKTGSDGGLRKSPRSELVGRPVVQDQSLDARQVPVCEALRDPGLTLQQPVEHGQHLVAGNGAESEARRGGLQRQRPGGGELGGGIDDARDKGGDLAMSPGSADGEDILGVDDGAAAVEQGLDPVDDAWRLFRSRMTSRWEDI